MSKIMKYSDKPIDIKQMMDILKVELKIEIEKVLFMLMEKK